MTRLEFISALYERLRGIPRDELEDRVSFYVEAIDDRMEDGLSEEDAVGDVGAVDDIASAILSEIPIGAIVKDKIKPKRRLSAWEITLIAVGSPIWLPLLISAIAVIFSVYASVWAVAVSLWSVPVSFGGCAIGGAFITVLLFIEGNPVSALAILGASVCLVGLSILSFYGCCKVMRGMAILTKKTALAIKKCFVRREEKR